MENTFNIIAVRVLEGCNSKIRKILKENTTYFLKNEYVYDEALDWVKPIDGKRAVPDDFYNDSENNISINISAIVGKNGDGKSSLVELVLRILNNFAFYAGFSVNREKMSVVEGVKAELFYRIDNEIYSIKCNYETIALRKNSDYVETLRPNDIYKSDFSFLKKYTSILFYTLVSNYSLYSYNSKDFKCDVDVNGKCWIDGVFHKNDGYQTPVVLNPLRKEGVIDINLENSLSIQRLMAMFVDGSIKEINNIVKPKGFKCRIKDGSILMNKTFKDYINKEHVILNNIYHVCCKDVEKIPKIKHQEIFNNNLFFWNLVSVCMTHEPSLFDETLDFFEHSKKEPFINIMLSRLNNGDDKIGITRYIFFLKRNRKLYGVVKGIINKFENHNYDVLDYPTLHRILLVYEIIKLWNQKFEELGIINTEDENLFSEQSLISKAKSYIIYKTIDIFESYTIQFNDVLNLLNSKNFFLDGNENYISCQKILRNSFDLLYKDITCDKSHLTLKIRQTLNYLCFNKDFNYLSLINDDKIIDFNEYGQNISKVIDRFDSFKPIDLLPPPIYDLEIQLLKENNIISFSTLSSGERQLLYSLSQIVYHIRNIDSIMVIKNTVNYNFVNLVFEEVELYFHPEFQQQFISRLLDIISKMKFKNIKGINMCFVTHSPFVLSDIPKNNVLFLKDGKPAYPMQEDTFGANIHTLLHNGFFLSNVPIGAFAQKKINSLFERLHNGEADEKLYDEIMLVSEPILKSQLLKLYKQNRIDNSQEIYELRKEIEELKARLDNLK